MWTYDHARTYAVAALRHEADAQEEGREDEVGSAFEDFDNNLPRGAGPEFNKLHTALWFWDEWIYARDHRWRTPVPAREEDWPALARHIASRIEINEDVIDPAVLELFGGR